MKFLKLFILNLCFLQPIFGQPCLPNGVTLTNQLEIDNFSISYPDCTEIEGDLIIEGPNIVNVLGLQNIISIGGSLNIMICHNLTTLTGLDNITSIGGSILIFDTGLTNLNGLQGVTAVNGDVDMSLNNSLTSLTGFDNLNTISGNFLLGSAEQLTDVSALNNLTSIGNHFGFSGSNLVNFIGYDNLISIGGDFHIDNNNALMDFTGMGSLTSIGGIVYITTNQSLVNFTGLQNLNTISGTVDIHMNSIENFNGLEGLTTVEGSSFRIMLNNDLTSLSGLQNINFTGTSTWLEVLDNSNLSFCATTNICNLIASGSTFLYIDNNGPACNSISEIQNQCGDLAILHYPIFYDINENGLLEPNEPFYPTASVNIDPLGFIGYGNPTNGGNVYLDFGDYTISYNQSGTPNWELTTDSTSYYVNLSAANINDTIYFGIHPIIQFSDNSSSIAASNARCNEWITFDVFVNNQGTTITEGTMWFTIDTTIIDVNYIDQPDTIIAPYTYGWNFNNLFPGLSIHKQIELLIPGPPGFPLGEFLDFITYADYSDINGQSSTHSFLYSTEVQCSFDPNDKLVYPVYPENYALNSEDLVYTIRFQNTGNAEAYDVIIRDTLDPGLDPSTFHVIGSSHEEILNTTIADDQYISFNFLDIYLPDSTTNFEGSQGYVIYSVRTYDNLTEASIVNNTASIYFDLNPPVITNTTENVMVSSLDADEDGFMIWEDCDDTDEDVNPDAEDIPNNNIDEDCDGFDLLVYNNNITNRALQVFPNPTNEYITIQLLFPTIADIQLIDITGQTVLRQSIQKEITLDLSAYTSSLYVLLVQSEGNLWSKRILKL